MSHNTSSVIPVAWRNWVVTQKYATGTGPPSLAGRLPHCTVQNLSCKCACNFYMYIYLVPVQQTNKKQTNKQTHTHTHYTIITTITTTPVITTSRIYILAFNHPTPHHNPGPITASPYQVLITTPHRFIVSITIFLQALFSVCVFEKSGWSVDAIALHTHTHTHTHTH